MDPSFHASTLTYSGFARSIVQNQNVATSSLLPCSKNFNANKENELNYLQTINSIKHRLSPGTVNPSTSRGGSYGQMGNPFIGGSNHPVPVLTLDDMKQRIAAAINIGDWTQVIQASECVQAIMKNTNQQGPESRILQPIIPVPRPPSVLVEETRATSRQEATNDTNSKNTIHQTKSISAIHEGIEQDHTFDKLNSAINRSDWDEVIRSLKVAKQKRKPAEIAAKLTTAPQFLVIDKYRKEVTSEPTPQERNVPFNLHQPQGSLVSNYPQNAGQQSSHHQVSTYPRMTPGLPQIQEEGNDDLNQAIFEMEIEDDEAQQLNRGTIPAPMDIVVNKNQTNNLQNNQITHEVPPQPRTNQNNVRVVVVITPNADGLYPCGRCTRVFPRKQTARLHTYTHMSWEELQKTSVYHAKCAVCHKIFLLKRSYEDHMNQHSGTRIHQCPVCDKKFVHKQTLYAHQLNHTEIVNQRHPCPHCNKTYVKLGRLTYHIKNEHSN